MRILEATDARELRELLARGEFFWLDEHDPSAARIDELAELLGWHPLAVEDAKEFGQRPKLDDYAQHALLVFYGVHAADVALTEVHLFLSGDWVVTVRRRPCNHLSDLHRRLDTDAPPTEEDVVYRVLDALTDSFFPVATALDEELDELEDAIMACTAPGQLEDVIGLRRRVGPIRRVTGAQRALFSSVGPLLDRLPGLERDLARDQFRDVADHLAVIADQFEAFRDRLGGALDLYSTQNANRLNEVTERLTLVATVFLPLSFVVGFFGQNFAWLTGHIQSLTTFLIWGGGGIVVPTLLIVGLFVRAGLLGRR